MMHGWDFMKLRVSPVSIGAAVAVAIVLGAVGIRGQALLSQANPSRSYSSVDASAATTPSASGEGSTAPVVSMTAGASATPGASPDAVSRPFRLILHGRTFVISGAGDCAALAVSDFYETFCTALLSPNWRAVPALAKDVGPTPFMFARIVRASLDQDTSVCSDPLTMSFARSGSRTPMTDAQAIASCDKTIADFATNGGAEIFDYTKNDNSDPLRVAYP